MFPEVRMIPGLIDSLRWLLLQEDSIPASKVLEEAQNKKLIEIGAENHLHADGAEILARIYANRDQLPDDASTFSRIICGIGELAARTNEISFSQLLSVFRPKMQLFEITDILDKIAVLNAGEVNAETQGRNWAQTIALSQKLSSAKIEDAVLEYAVSILDMPYRFQVYGAYGMKLCVSIAMHCDLHDVDKWVQSHPNDPALAVISTATVDRMEEDEDGTFADLILTSKIPLFICIAAASFVGPSAPYFQRSIKETFQRLIRSDIEPEECLCITAFLMRDIMRHRNQIRNKVPYLKNELDGLLEIATVDWKKVVHLKAAIKDQESLLGKAEDSLVLMLDELVDIWSHYCLSDEKLTSIGRFALMNSEIRYLVAVRFKSGRNKQRLLENNLSDFKKLLGDKDDFNSQFFIQRKELMFIAEWTAKSLILLYQDDQRGVGKRTSDVVDDLMNSVNLLIEQPYIVVRKPQEVQSAIARGAAGCIFVFLVAHTFPPPRLQELKVLINFVVHQALDILSISFRQNELQAPLLRQMTMLLWHFLPLYPDLHSLDEQYVRSDKLPSFPRAVIIFAIPELFEKHEHLALYLLENLGEVPRSKFLAKEALNDLLSILDIAISCGWRSANFSFLNRIDEFWLEKYDVWAEKHGNRWRGAARLLIDAVTGEEKDLAALEADRTFGQGSCRQILRHWRLIAQDKTETRA